MRDRPKAPLARVARVMLVAIGALVVAACNPMLDQPTRDIATGSQWRTHHYTYKRLFLMQEGDALRITFDGAAASVTPDVAAVDDGGTVVAEGSFHDDTGPYEPVAWTIC